MSFQHSFVPDDEGLFCLFCGRTAGEHIAGGADGEPKSLTLSRGRVEDAAGIVEEEDDWDAIQAELKRLTRKCQEQTEMRVTAETLLNEMKDAFEKLREDVGVVRTWGANSDGQLGHYGGKVCPLVAAPHTETTHEPVPLQNNIPRCCLSERHRVCACACACAAFASRDPRSAAPAFVRWRAHGGAHR